MEMPLLEVCLMDDSPLTGYLGAILRKPEAIVWLRTGLQKQVVSRIESELSGKINATYESREIQPEIEDFIEQCKQIIKDYPEHDIVLNTSGGDPLYILLAAEVFKQAEKEVIFIDTNHSRLVNIRSGEKKSFQLNLTVNEYSALQGIEIESGTRFDPEIGKRSGLSYFIGNNVDDVVPFIDKIRQEWNDMGDNKQDIQWKMNAQHRFVVTYEAAGDKMRFRFGNPERQKTMEIVGSGADYLFNGGWLRELVFLRVHRSQYDDVRLDVRLNRNSIPEGLRAESMIDIAMMKGCHFYIFQCFSYPITRESFIELSAVQNTIKLLNAKGFVFLAHHPYRGFLERASDAGVNVIYGKRIANFSI
jgi:hypothetical protein